MKSEAKIVKVGNSYGLRLPKEYLKEHGLKAGDYLELPIPKRGDVSKVLTKMGQLAKTKGPITSIPDPVAWQRAQRKSTNPWHEAAHDTAR